MDWCRAMPFIFEKPVFDNNVPDSKVHGANMGLTWVLLAPDGPHVGLMNLANRGVRYHDANLCYRDVYEEQTHKSKCNKRGFLGSEMNPFMPIYPRSWFAYLQNRVEPWLIEFSNGMCGSLIDTERASCKTIFNVLYDWRNCESKALVNAYSPLTIKSEWKQNRAWIQKSKTKNWPIPEGRLLNATIRFDVNVMRRLPRNTRKFLKQSGSIKYQNFSWTWPNVHHTWGFWQRMQLEVTNGMIISMGKCKKDSALAMELHIYIDKTMTEQRNHYWYKFP